MYDFLNDTRDRIVVEYTKVTSQEKFLSANFIGLRVIQAFFSPIFAKLKTI